ncbi:MAG: hypothetical protein KAJ18_05630 [Candidatus Omnitrophica bacterium]|nr:hypothetical protein [Candidatus Omnitrophota bacterium]
MPSIDVFAVVGVVLVLILLGVLFFVPTSKKSSTRKSKAREDKQEIQKDWQAVSLKLERHIQALRKDIDKLQRSEKGLESDLELQQEKYKKLQEKLEQERGWQKKETTDIERKTKEIIRLKEDLKKAEHGLGENHSKRLLLERELKEARAEVEGLTRDKRALESENTSIKNQAGAYRKEIQGLKAENHALSKKHDDATWVAKSEYVKLEKMLKITKMELEKLRREK